MLISIQPPSFWSSLGWFAYGVLKRWYFFVFAFLLDPLDLFNKYVSPKLPEGYRVTYDLPMPLFWVIAAMLFVWVAALTYHDLRKGGNAVVNDLTDERNDAVSRQQDLEHERDSLATERNILLSEQSPEARARAASRLKIAYLEGIREHVVTFLSSRPGKGEDHATGCGIGLAKCMHDAISHGMYEHPDFAKERYAIQGTGEDFKQLFLNLGSQMRKQRSVSLQGPFIFSQALPFFHQHFLEDIDKAIKFEKELSGD